MMIASENGVRVEGPLGPDELRDCWAKAEPMIAKALERDGFKSHPRDLLERAAEGVIGFYSVRDDETDDLLAILACEAVEYPHAMVFNIAYAAGKDLYRWAGLLGAMEREAVRLGCDTVRITGRPGWGRIFPDYHEVNRLYERKVMVEL